MVKVAIFDDGRSRFKPDGFFWRVEVIFARLDGPLVSALVLAAEAAVVAVAAAGSRTGLVGERGRGLPLGGVDFASSEAPLVLGDSNGP